MYILIWREKWNMICFEYLKSFISVDILIHHIRHLHPFAQNFICKQNNCQRTFPTLNGLKKHFINNHTKDDILLHSDAGKQKRSNNINLLKYENVIQDDSVDESDGTKCINDKPFDSSELFYNAMLNFISKMYSNSSLPRNIVTAVVNNTKELCNIILVCIESTLKNVNVAEDILNAVLCYF